VGGFPVVRSLVALVEWQGTLIDPLNVPGTWLVVLVGICDVTSDAKLWCAESAA